MLALPSDERWPQRGRAASRAPRGRARGRARGRHRCGPTGTKDLPTGTKDVSRRSPSCFSSAGGGGIISPLCMASGNRCPGRFALASSERMRSTTPASNACGSHWPAASGRSRPPLGATHSSLPPCAPRGVSRARRRGPGSVAPATGDHRPRLMAHQAEALHDQHDMHMARRGCTHVCVTRCATCQSPRGRSTRAAARAPP